MFGTRMPLFSIRLLGLTGLAFFLIMSTGCATRALMSSDRYEKPKPETQQFRSSNEISKSWQPDSINLEQRYLLAVKSKNLVNTNI